MTGFPLPSLTRRNYKLNLKYIYIENIIFYIIINIIIFFLLQQKQPNMETQNITLIKQYFQYFNEHNWAKMAEMSTENSEFKNPTFGIGIVKQTRTEIIKKYSELNKSFSDLKDEVLQIYPSGEQHMIVEFVSSGTAPDGSKFELPICTIFTIENEKITKDFTYFDNFEE